MVRRMIQSGRAVVHFGPWRHAARAIIRWARPPHSVTEIATRPCFGVDAAQLIRDLREYGIAPAGILPANPLSRIQAISDRLPPGEYGEFNAIADVLALTQCATNIAREYLQAEPELLECSLFVANAEDPAVRITRDSDRHYHFEDAGWHSLSLFVYLTEVSDDSSAHQVVTGTHRALHLQDAIRGIIPEGAIQHRYTGRIRTIIGPPGTMFFEDTSAIHRRRLHTRRHAILHVLFVSYRSWASGARRMLRYSDYLRSHPESTTTDA